MESNSKYNLNSVQKRSFAQDILSIHHIDQKSLEFFFDNYSPVFFLNTGRSGSAFLDNVFKNIDCVDAYHEAFPNLMMFPNFAFHHQHQNDILRKIIEASRLELILESFIKNKLFIETNHCLVFFAYQIKELFPKARFVHVLRHPGDFVRSAIMKGWHKNDTIWENNRIRINNSEWSNRTQVERLSWLWMTTHNYIEDFMMTITHEKLTIKLEELVSSREKFKEMISFLDKEIILEDRLIGKLQTQKVNEIFIDKSEPSNMFKLASYPKYSLWDEDQKDQLRKYCSELANKHEYSL